MGIIVVDSYTEFGSTALGVTASFNDPSDGTGTVQLIGAGGSTMVTNDGTSGGSGDPVIRMTCTPSGGDGSYSFQWGVTESSDTGNHTIHTTGTQTNQNYNGLRIQSVLPSGFPPFASAEYRITITVTDGNGDTAGTELLLTVVSISI